MRKQKKNKKLNPDSRFVVSSQNPIFFVISSIQNVVFDFVPWGGVHQKFQDKIYQRSIKNELLPPLLLCDRAIFVKIFWPWGGVKQKWKQKINRERRSNRVKHQNSEQNFCKFLCFLGKTKYKIVPFLFGNFSEMTKKQKIFCKKTPPQGTKSGKSKHKNIEPINSRIDGLFFHFCFCTSPRA